MRRMIGAILIDTRPDRIIMSAWRGEARIDLGAEARDVVPRRADHRDHLDRAAGEAEAERQHRVAARPVLRLLEAWSSSSALLDVLLEVLALELAAQQLCARSWRSGGRRRTRCCGSLPFERSSSPDVDERHEQQRDEDDRLDEREDPERLELHGDRVEEDDLDVEQDEEHRDQVEADPEAEVLRDVRRQAALVRLALDLARPPRPEQRVRERKTPPSKARGA